MALLKTNLMIEFEGGDDKSKLLRDILDRLYEEGELDKMVSMEANVDAIRMRFVRDLK